MTDFRSNMAILWAFVTAVLGHYLIFDHYLIKCGDYLFLNKGKFIKIIAKNQMGTKITLKKLGSKKFYTRYHFGSYCKVCIKNMKNWKLHYSPK